MFEYTTIARPYAKAAFDFAIEHNSVNRWYYMLFFATEVLKNNIMSNFLCNTLSQKTLAELFITICGEQLDCNGQNLIRLIVYNNRLKILPDVLKQFKKLRVLSEATVETEIISANVLSDEQLTKLTSVIEKRLSRKVNLNYRIDKSIIAGVIIRIGNMVIDGSVRNRLNCLAYILQI